MQLHDKGRQQNIHTIPNIYISDSLFRTFENLENLSLSFDVKTNQVLSSENVLGFIEGSDLKEEIVVITAHYDHIGYDNGEVCNGADDDGSGTVSLLEIAEAFSIAKREGLGPRRSILFMTVSGEEKGLLGSQYYSENPIFPLENTIVDLNIDMIGRKDSLHDNENYVYLIGADRISKDLHYISEKVNNELIHFQLDYTYNDENDPNHFYYRSDHYNFAKHNIPVIFYFSGVHEDYHKPTDDVDKIMFPKLATTAQLIFYTAWEIANRNERLKKNA
ncbi:MAG: M28 family peptidase [Flavobacteriales bacterium]|nr:M28 family peptidase [Flavobacteriales bacterium]